MKLDALTAFGFVTSRSTALASSAVAGPASPAYPPIAQPIPVGIRLTATASPEGASAEPISWLLGKEPWSHSVDSIRRWSGPAALTNHRNGSPASDLATAASTPPGSAIADEGIS